MRSHRRLHRASIGRLLTILLVGLGILQFAPNTVLPEPVVAAPAAAPEARVSAGSAFGVAQPCLTQPETFVTTLGANTMYFPQGSRANTVSSRNLPALSTVTMSSASPLSSLGQLGAVYGLAYDDGSMSGRERLFVGAFTKRLTPYGPAGAGGVYIFARAGASWSYIAAFQVPGAVAATHTASGADPSDKASIAAVGKTSLGDLEISADGRTLYIVNIGPKRIERYDLMAATSTPSRLSPIGVNLTSISSDPAVQTDLYPFALEMVPAGNRSTDPFIAVGVTDTAERGTRLGELAYAPGGSFAVSPQAHVLLYNTANPWWGKILTQDLGNDPAIAGRHEKSVFAGVITDWNNTPDHYLVKAWNPWRDNLLQLPEQHWVIHYPQPWLTDIEFLSYTPAQGAPVTNVPNEMVLGLRDRTGDLVFNANVTGEIPIPAGERAAIAQGDQLIYRYNGSAWIFQGERLDDNSHYGPANAHVENQMGALASLPNVQTGPSAIGESLGSTSLGGLGTQEVRYYSWASGAATSGAITARPQLITIDTHAATKASNLGDLEVLCSYALVGGRVWNDANFSGTQNSGEGGIAGVTLDVELPNDGGILASAITDAQGRYLFAVPPNTSFNIHINAAASGQAIAGYWLTSQGDGTETTDSDMSQVGAAIPFVRPGETTTLREPIAAPWRESEGRSYDIGLTQVEPTGSIGDRVWLDTDGDGIQDTGERGYALPGVITLDALSDEPGAVDQTAKVMSNGLYNFGYLVPGTYQLRFPTPPAGYRASPQNRGSDEIRDSDVGPGYTTPPFVYTGGIVTTWDFGVVGGADIAITKIGPATVAAGALLTYTLTVRNQSPDAAPAATITDTLPAGLTYVSANPAPTSRSGQTIVWSMSPLAGGVSQSLTLVARAPTTLIPATAFAQSVQNCADVGISTPDPDPGDNRGCATTIVQRPEIGIRKEATPTVSAGDEITYTLTISNSGALPAAGVLVSDTLPAGLTFTRFSANPLGCVAAATRVTCSATAFAAGANETVRFVARTDPATVPDMVTNTTIVSTASAGDALGNNSSSASTAIQRPDLELTLQLNPRPLPVGEPGSVTAIYRNLGTGLASSSTLTVTMEPGAQVGATPGGCTYNTTANEAVCLLGDLDSGASGSLTLPLRLPATPTDEVTFSPDAYGVTAALFSTSAERPSALANNNASDIVDVVRPNVYITASGPDEAARLSWGSAYFYVLGYGNRYAANPGLTHMAAGSSITATLPPDATFVSASVAPSRIAGRTLVWELGDLAPQAAGTLTITVRTNVPAGATLHLAATITTATPGDDLRDNDATVETLIVQPPVVVPDARGLVRLAIHSDLDPNHGGLDASDGVYLTPPGATRIAWPTGEALDFTPRLDAYTLPDPGWPLEYRARVLGWGLSAFANNGRETPATGADSRGIVGCRGAGGPTPGGSALAGCAYAYPGAYGDGRRLDAFLPARGLLESEMAVQAHVYWTQPPAPPMRPDVYLFTLDPLEPPRLQVAVEVEVWLVNACPDLLAPPYVCGAALELPTPPRRRQALEQSFDVTLVVPRSVVGPTGP